MRIFAARPAVVVDALPTSFEMADLVGKEADTLLLTWEQRRWMRGRFTTEKGREIGVALPTGVQIEPGQIMWIGSDWYLTMGAAIEPLLKIHAGDRKRRSASLSKWAICTSHWRWQATRYSCRMIRP